MAFFENNYNSVRYPIATETSDGLRRAQIGAIHAIAAHFTYHTDSSNIRPAIVVMPTGSGKTAVLMLAAFVLRAKKVLVISPSRLVCDQTAEEFQSLKLLKDIGALENVSGTHTVCNLKHKLTSSADWTALQEHDVIVSTPNCVSPAYQEVADPPPGFFDLVLFDEAHHAPAKTWKAILSAFPHAKKVHFTATPFRSDRKEIEGIIVYEFSVREAYEDKIFGFIGFVPVVVEKQTSEDVAIAQKAQEIFDTDRSNNFDHYLMVRTNTKRHARLLKEVYKDHTRLNLRIIHSGHSLTHVERTIRELKAHKLDGIICVDMLGEGFDFPNLKIAAVHAPHKSLAVTLQFIGRFARTRAKPTEQGEKLIGEAKFIAVPNSIRLDAEQLYRQGKVWQEIIPGLYEERIGREKYIRRELSAFDKIFEQLAEVDEEAADLSLSALTPFHHVKIYYLEEGARLDSGIKPPRRGPLEDLEELMLGRHYRILEQYYSQEHLALIVLMKEISVPKWISVPMFASTVYNLLVIYFDNESGLLFINASRRTDSMYDKIVEQVAIDGFRPLSLRETNRVLAGLDEAEFFNVGMRNRLLTDQTESYRIIAGTQAHRAIRQSDAELYHRGHVFGRGGSGENTVTLGYSDSSKVWSNTYSSIPELVDWCRALARLIQSNENVSTGSELDRLSVGEKLRALPDNIFFVSWPKSAYLSPPLVSHVTSAGVRREVAQLLDFDLAIDRVHTDENRVRVRIEGLGLVYEVDFDPFTYPFFAEASKAQPSVLLGWRNREIDLLGYLNQKGLYFYTADQSFVFGSEIVRAPRQIQPFDTAQMEIEKWETNGVDIQKEFGTPSHGYNHSVHSYLESRLVASGADLVFYDHGTGEIADYITFRLTRTTLRVALYHVKASGGASPGQRVDDAYEVCGQAVKCTIWLQGRKLHERITYRAGKGHPFCKGDMPLLDHLMEKADVRRTEYEIVVVQPGFSKSKLPAKISKVLASTDDYLVRAGCEKLMVIASQ